MPVFDLENEGFVRKNAGFADVHSLLGRRRGCSIVPVRRLRTRCEVFGVARTLARVRARRCCFSLPETKVGQGSGGREE